MAENIVDMVINSLEKSRGLTYRTKNLCHNEEGVESRSHNEPNCGKAVEVVT